MDRETVFVLACNLKIIKFLKKYSLKNPQDKGVGKHAWASPGMFSITMGVGKGVAPALYQPVPWVTAQYPNR